MHGLPAEVLSVLLLLATLGWAVARPPRWPEAVVAVPAAAVVIATGAVSLGHAREEAVRLGPVIAFLAAVLVLSKLCADEGLFHACGMWMARRASRAPAEARPGRLLVAVFAAASLTTAVLSLDTTVVLLTPVVFATAARLGVRAKPHVYACTHLSNSASLLLPVSNLTNLLALAATGLTFTRFAGLMLLPWLAAVAVEYAVFRRFFAADLEGREEDREAPGSLGEPEVPLFPLVTVVCTLAGFVVTSVLGLEPAWAAAAGALVLGARALRRGHTSPRGLLVAAGLPFLAFVVALAVVVRAVVDNGLADWLGRLVPDGSGLLALLAVAGLAAVLANVINNLPAVLVLLPLTAPGGAGPVLAVLLGVNIGPSLTYAGSLATLLWRQTLHQHAHRVGLREFTRLGLFTVPPALALSVLALWGSLHVLG
ncbi:arsenic transporter [Streptomyces tubbatahanensis]|uniref:Arsenic transporter n=1 Tax=Streptomyces tubbatahanensis TaxID=2923272 RepID=A0ABY3XQ39_9ACTN|nr:SLC13 family permease [Streptomyces tubbatahanensis]UNS96581.1 arsenic transporter [Streptomyces tubbatahanensis]